MEKLYTISEDILHLTTLRIWDKQGKIKCIRLSNRYRRIPESEINRIMGKKDDKFEVIYARVSTRDQKNDLGAQIERLIAVARGARVFSDVRSGMRFSTRNGFTEVMKLVEENKVSRIYITHRLARFGYDLVETICKNHGTEIIEVDGEEILSAQEELTRDLISIITSFSARLYGFRSHKAKEILKVIKP
ncbi:MAG: IS607 family transposase [Conexivisphaerales archaeon]